MIKNLPKEKRDRLILIAIGTVAVTVGIYLGLVKAQKRTLDRISKQTVEQRKRLAAPNG